jgi:sugar phosphate isomerase/epimerase
LELSGQLEWNYKLEIFCSTGGFKTQTFYDTASSFLDVGINNIELSAGKIDLDFHAKLHSLNSRANLMLHNYFPPAEEPIVLNLASTNEALALKSLNFYKEIINLSAMLSTPAVGIHAGFLLDPLAQELGKTISASKLFSRDQAMSLFIQRVKELSAYAASRDVRLLVENNVLSNENFKNHECNILLLADGGEIVDFMRELGGDVGLLLDVGHLKVSSNTLQFDLLHAFQLLQEFTEGYHLSENLGESDDHFGFDLDAWFVPLLNPRIAFGTLEIDNLDASGIARLSAMLSNYLQGKL